MAPVQSGSESGIPSVTPADLERFQKIHFTPNDSSTISEVYAHTPHVNTAHEEVAEEDDLGYYPDGVKRTLTDEQIAMFRHSEIYSLLRKRQLRKENREMDEDASVSPTNTEAPNLQREPLFLVLNDESIAESTKIYGPGGKTLCSMNTEEAKLTDLTDLYGPARENRVKITGKRKRKRADQHERRNINQGTTPRRQARELDNAVADVGSLDYGEEPSVDQSNSNSTQTEMQRAQVDYTNHDDLEDPQTNQEALSSKEGRKIWWPAIG
ncbi:MAG: hypothetical protein Q9178_000753 [Gyalolechia marmorata]